MFLMCDGAPPAPQPITKSSQHTPIDFESISELCWERIWAPCVILYQAVPSSVPPFHPASNHPIPKGCRNSTESTFTFQHFIRLHIFTGTQLLRLNLCIQQYFTLSQSRRVASTPDSHRSVPGIAHYPTQPCSWQTSVSHFFFSSQINFLWQLKKYVCLSFQFHLIRRYLCLHHLRSHNLYFCP